MARANPRIAGTKLPPGAALLRPPTATRPALWLSEIAGRPAIFKDYRWCRPKMRLLGRFLVKRERAMYTLLSGSPGIPRCYGLLNPHCLAVEYIPGKDCFQFDSDELPDEFFERLDAVVRALHRRGVAHCDLKHRENIVVTRDFRPYLVDLNTALPRGSPWNPVQRWAFRLFAADDLKALVKIRYYLCRGQVSEAEWLRISRPSPFEWTVRRMRDSLRGLLRAVIGRRAI